MSNLLALGRGYQVLSTQDDRGLTWEGLPPSQGGPAVILVEARDGPGSALLATRVARTVVGWLTQGALLRAQDHLTGLMRDFRADAPAVTILALQGTSAVVATCGGHRIASHRGRRGRVVEGDPLRPRIAQVTWRPGSTVVALALGTGGALPIGSVGRALTSSASPFDACRLLVREAQVIDPHLHHGAVLLTYPEGHSS